MLCDYKSREEGIAELKSLTFMEFVKKGSDSGTLYELVEIVFGEENYDAIDAVYERFNYDGEALYNWLKEKVQNESEIS